MDNLDGPPPPRKKKRQPCGKRHRWVWSGYGYKGEDIYKCKYCGKVKMI